MKKVIIIDGSRAQSYIEIGRKRDHLTRLLDGGVIRPATKADTDQLRRCSRVYYPRSSAAWGSGEYVLQTGDVFYAMDNDFNLGHLELAIRRMSEQDRDEQRDDLYERIGA